jgi:hypothetical protein
MNKKLIIFIVVVAVLGGATAGAWAVIANAGPKDLSASTTKTDAEAPGAQVEPETGQVASEDGSTSATEMATEPHGAEFEAGDMSESADNSEWTDFASEAVTAYQTWDTAEPAEDRSARLSKYFAPGAPELTSVPGQAGEAYFDFVDFTSTVEVTEIIYAGFESPNEDPNIIDMVVMTNYEAAFRSAADTRGDIGSASWSVQVRANNPSQIVSLSQN